jgi:hypothetical protein
MSPQRSTLSRIGSDYTAPVDSRAQRQYKSGMYRPEDNAYIQNYARQDNLKHLFYTECSNSVFNNNPGTVTGMFVRPDDSTLFVTGANGDPFFEYPSADNSITSMPLNNGSIKSISASTTYNRKYLKMGTSSENGASYTVIYPEPSGISFKPDGTRLIICGNLIRVFYGSGGSQNFYYYGPVIFQYNLNTVWNLNSMNANSSFTLDGVTYYIDTNFVPVSYSYAPDRKYALDGESIKLTSTDSYSKTLPNPKIRGIFVKPDGTRLYYLRNDVLYQSDISSSWDIGSDGANLSAAGSRDFADGDNYFVSISFSSDGTTLYLLGRNYGGVLYVYNLSAAWDITTATYNSYLYVGQYKTLGYNSSSQTASSYFGTGMAFSNNQESLIVSNNYNSAYNRYFQFDTLAF